MENREAGQPDGGQVSPETAAAVRQIINDATNLKRLLDDLHPAEDDTAPLRALAAAMSLTGQPQVEAARGTAEEARSQAEMERFGMQLGSDDRPIEGFVRNTGLSLERLSNSAAERYPYGWHLRFHVPAELLEKDPAKAAARNRAWWIVGLIIITALAAGLVVLLGLEDGRRAHLDRSTTGAAAVIGGWIAIAFLPALACVGLVRWRSANRVSIDLERQMPAVWAVAGLSGSSPGPQDGAGIPGATPAQTANSSQSDSRPSDGAAPATQSGSLVSREPVLLGSLLTAGGTLALGLSGALGTSALAAVSAGAIGAVGLLVRELVTPKSS